MKEAFLLIIIFKYVKDFFEGMNEKQKILILKKQIMQTRRIVLRELRKLENIEGFDEFNELTRTKNGFRKFGQKLSEMITLFEQNRL